MAQRFPAGCQACRWNHIVAIAKRVKNERRITWKVGSQQLYYYFRTWVVVALELVSKEIPFSVRRSLDVSFLACPCRSCRGRPRPFSIRVSGGSAIFVLFCQTDCSDVHCLLLHLRRHQSIAQYTVRQVAQYTVCILNVQSDGPRFEPKITLFLFVCDLLYGFLYFLLWHSRVYFVAAAAASSCFRQ